MEACRVFIIGGSLFADGMAHMLAGSHMAEVAGSAPTLEVALSLLKTDCADAVIMTAPNQNCPVLFEPLLMTCPDLSIIYVDLGRADRVQIITSRRIEPHRSDLLAAIAAIPRRNR
jgi:hypothetical protein